MLVKGCDIAWGRPSYTDLAARGYKFVFRYLSYDDPKNLHADEPAAIHASGMGVGVFWETTADQAAFNDPQSATQAGAREGTDAGRMWDQIGLPRNNTMALCVANDEDMPQAQWANSAAFLDAFFKAAGPGILRGGYGNNGWCQQMFVDHHIDVIVQTVAWSHGQQVPETHVYQDGTQDTVDGVSVDVDWADDHFLGVWWPGQQPPPPPPPPPPQGDAVKSALSISTDPQGNGDAPCDGKNNRPLISWDKARAVTVNASDPETNHSYTPIPRVAFENFGGICKVIMEGGPPNAPGVVVWVDHD